MKRWSFWLCFLFCLSLAATTVCWLILQNTYLPILACFLLVDRKIFLGNFLYMKGESALFIVASIYYFKKIPHKILYEQARARIRLEFLRNCLFNCVFKQVICNDASLTWIIVKKKLNKFFNYLSLKSKLPFWRKFWQIFIKSVFFTVHWLDRCLSLKWCRDHSEWVRVCDREWGHLNPVHFRQTRRRQDFPTKWKLLETVGILHNLKTWFTASLRHDVPTVSEVFRVGRQEQDGEEDQLLQCEG